MTEKKVEAKPILVFNQAGQQAKKRTAKEASCWVYSPGSIYFLREGEKLICSLGIKGGPALKQVDYIRAAWAQGTHKVYLLATDESDPDAVEVTRSKKRVNCNLSDTLTAWKLAMPVNTRSRFRLVSTTPDDLLYPAVVLDLSAVLETRTLTRSKKKKESEQKAETSSQTAKKETAEKAEQAETKPVPQTPASQTAAGENE